MAGFGGNWRDFPPNPANVGLGVALRARFVAPHAGCLRPTRDRLMPATRSVGLAACREAPVCRSKVRACYGEVSGSANLGVGCSFFVSSRPFPGLACRAVVPRRGVSHRHARGRLPMPVGNLRQPRGNAPRPRATARSSGASQPRRTPSPATRSTTQTRVKLLITGEPGTAVVTSWRDQG